MNDKIKKKFKMKKIILVNKIVIFLYWILPFSRQNYSYELEVVCNSSQYSAALLVCGITIVPPTILATAKTSYTSAVVTFISWALPR